MPETDREMMILGALLRAERDELLTRWRARVRGLPGAAGLDVPALNDHVPDLIEELACQLEAACEPQRLPRPVTDNPVIHGRQRFEVGMFALASGSARRSSLTKVRPRKPFRT
jgi:hypothetical protein